MPGLKANMTNKAKTADKSKTGGGGAAGMAARKSGGDTMSCAICKSSMNSKVPKAMVMLHVDGKHPKNTLEQCFPDYVEPAK
jgi:hypothetical protein